MATDYGKTVFPQDFYRVTEEGRATAEQHFAALFNASPLLRNQWQKLELAQEALLFSFRLGLQHIDHFITRDVPNAEPEAVPSNLQSIVGLNAIAHKVFSAVKDDPWLGRHINWDFLARRLDEEASIWKEQDFEKRKEGEDDPYPVSGSQIQIYYDNLEVDPWLPGLKEALSKNLRPQDLPPAGLDSLFIAPVSPVEEKDDLVFHVR